MLRATGLLAVAVFLISTRVMAVDTVEPFGEGAFDLEYYAGVNGLGRGVTETTLDGALQLGYGLTPRVSAFVSGGLSSDTRLLGGDGEVGLGVFATVVDGRHFDADLFLSSGFGRDGLICVGGTLGLELNLDLGPFGLFATACETMSGRKARSREDCPSVDHHVERFFDTEAVLGGHWVVADGHQVLASYDFVVHHVPEPEQPCHEAGRVGLGYNVMIHEAVELIHEGSWEIPQGEKTGALGFMVGVITTLP